MSYWPFLLGLSLAFAALERLWPRRPRQRFLRPGLFTDLVYVVFNGHLLGVLLAYAADPLSAGFARALSLLGLAAEHGIAADWPWWVQLSVAFVALDFVQWCIHNLLHRVPWLWEVHKIHHSITCMDFWGAMRFHLGESVVYRSLQYLPLLWFGFEPSALFWVAVASTAIGYFNHANLRVDLGPLRYLLNGPQMHLWHHAHPEAGPSNVNFGINLALWDWLFGTAYLPLSVEAPSALGFTRVESFPRGPVAQTLCPFVPRLRTSGEPAA